MEVIALDNVNLLAAVPEPENYAMLLAGLGMFGLITRRRRKTR
ncbi:MAG: PEP-CTERM sorting domain-containing protein [Gammaproteobacteria bacterium]|nr:MAG: PEP-CTERM sorting domain-containing protein [Gammaproteobacteria bacterium]